MHDINLELVEQVSSKIQSLYTSSAVDVVYDPTMEADDSIHRLMSMFPD